MASVVVTSMYGAVLTNSTFFGADFSTTVRDWFGLRGEGAYRLPIECQTGPCSFAAKPDVQWVLGIDREQRAELPQRRLGVADFQKHQA